MAQDTETVEFDPQVYFDKEPTDKMKWYQEWLTKQFGEFPGLKNFPLKQVALAVTLYPVFQKSDFNRSRTDQKREARAAEAAAPKEKATTTKAAAAKPATTGRRGRPPGSGNKASGAKAGTTAPATGRRGRGKPASQDAPF